MGLLLLRFRDVPTLGRDHGSVDRDLIFLLPQRPPRASRAVGSSEEIRKVSAVGAIWAIAGVLLYVMQMMSVFTTGSGDQRPAPRRPAPGKGPARAELTLAAGDEASLCHLEERFWTEGAEGARRMTARDVVKGCGLCLSVPRRHTAG
ncbi:hypothetical protein [Rhodovulum strictum]|uniref:hypothetical protein n=1 Tax=Rhodovulum strictum TaxID=58314 RepID=UPI001FE26171|nr:hypothetical protein [Rhodovulum strictum]